MSRLRIDVRLAAFFVVALVSVGLREAWRGNWLNAAGSAESSELLIAGLVIEEIVRIEVRIDERSDLLHREESGWEVVSGNNPGAAHAPSVDALLATMGELREGRVVADDLVRATRFGFGELRGLHITLIDGDGEVVADVHVGSMDARGSFFRRDDEDLIRKFGEDLSSGLRPRRVARFGWRDDTILEEGDGAEILRVHLDGPKGRVTLERSDEGLQGDAWVLTAPRSEPAAPLFCGMLCEDLSQLRAERFYDGKLDPAQLGLEEPDVVVATAEWPGGRETVLEVGAKEIDGLFPVRRHGNPTVWLIPHFRGANFRGNADYFLKR